MSVQTAVKEIDEITREISVTIPAAMVQEKINQFVGKVQKTASFNGFRPGKAPRQLVEKVHGERIRYEVTNELITDSLSSTFKDHKIISVGSPEIQSLKQDAGKDIEYTAKVEILPRPALKDYKNLSVKVPKRDVTDVEIEQVITRLRDSKSTSKPNTSRNKVEGKDIVEALVKVEIEGEPPSTPEQVTIQLGEERLPKEVETGLQGVGIGETKVIDIVIGADHPNAQLRGKKVAYEITINGLAEKVLPELTDEFAKGLGLEVDGVAALKGKIREQLEAEHKNESRSDIQAEILNVLAADHAFKVPQALIDDEIRSLLARNRFVDPEKMDLARLNVEPFRERMGESAAKRVKTLILVDQYAEHQKIEPSEADIEKAMAELAEKNSVSVDDVRKYFLSSDRASSFSLEVRRTKVLEWFESIAKVEYTDPLPAEAGEVKPAAK